MTGLERWAADNGTTANEIRILTVSESPDGWETILGASLTGPDAFPSGRDTALSGMLERARNGNVDVRTDAVGFVLGCATEEVTAMADRLMVLMPEGNAWNITKDDGKAIDSAALPYLLQAMSTDMSDDGIRGIAEKLADMMRAAMQPKPAKGSKNKKAPKKGKYSVSKAALAAMLKPGDGTVPIREIRMFLLSVPGAKPADVAVMSDQEASDTFSSEYASVQMGQGTVIMPASDCEKLVDFMGTLSTYYIPSADEN